MINPVTGFYFTSFWCTNHYIKEPPMVSFDKTWIFSPFPHRLARRPLVMPEEEIAKREILINMAIDQFTQRLYKFWVTIQ
ncbi:hypothetical protein FBQ80_04260 [Candidatus Brocadia sp. AMX2]|nr:MULTISPECIES: hypothetical protein [Brocadia]MDL1934792.1 hypothetical protein [Candidatus Brocadia sp. AMX2]NOG43233.1 hypothetical protein [Planctomycetota bacterium]